MYQYEYKIGILGDTRVGKTSLLEKYVDSRSCYEYNPTIGVDCRTKSINVNGCMYKLKIWDISGGDKFNKLVLPYISNLDACIIVFDITNISSMKNIKKWLSLAQSKNSVNMPIIIVANKYDIKHSQHVEPYVDATMFNSKNFTNCSFIQSSIKMGYNVDQIFISLVQQLIALKNVPMNRTIHRFEYSEPTRRCKLFSYFRKK